MLWLSVTVSQNIAAAATTTATIATITNEGTERTDEDASQKQSQRNVGKVKHKSPVKW